MVACSSEPFGSTSFSTVGEATGATVSAHERIRRVRSQTVVHAPPSGPQIVTDPDDPRIADFADLTDATARRAVEGSGGHGLFIVEGVITVGQLLASDYPVRSVLLTPSRAESLGDLVAAVPDDVPVMVAERSVLRAVTGFNVHRGVLASADRMALPTAEHSSSAP